MIPNYINCSALTPFDAGEGANGHLYAVRLEYWVPFRFASDFAARLNSCCDKDAHLASITSQVENDFVVSLVPEGGRPGWIGLSNMNQSDYTWDASNETVNYTNWCGPPAPGCDVQEPDLPTSSCAAIRVPDGLWSDYDCAYEYPYFIVEYDCD
jgi:hypothetical protein